MKILDSKQMRNIDARAAREYGLAGVVLMENAGSAAADALEDAYPDIHQRRVAVVCGKGNNGGDGFVLARHLINRGADVQVYLLAAEDEVQGDAAANLRILLRMGAPVLPAARPEEWEAVLPEILGADILVDAILGTGIKGAVRGPMQRVITSLAAFEGEVVALDLPSGLSADSPAVRGEAVVADRTLAMALPKIAHLFPPAELFCGQVSVLDIGLPEKVIADEGVDLNLLQRGDALRAIPPRRRNAHKGEFGHVLVVAGSRGKSGAAALAALGALRSGAGLVTVATARSAQPAVAAHAPEIMVEGLPETERGCLSRKALPALRRLMDGADAVVLGPGLGVGADAGQLVRALVAEAPQPLVLDADGLTVLAGKLDPLRRRRGGDRILTPHPGEMARLLDLQSAQVQEDRLGVGRRFAHDHGCTLVLKGYRTLVASPAAGTWVNPTGNPGMATAGSGDVLAGMIGGLVAQCGETLAGTLAAVYLHGLAGDLAAAHRGDAGMIAGDLVEHLPEAIKTLRSGDPEEE